jgi:hypothetical protein
MRKSYACRVSRAARNPRNHWGFSAIPSGRAILGALRLADELFDQQPDADRRTLIIFSDMRQSTPDLDLEAPNVLPPFATVTTRCGAIPRLRNVQIYVLGADGAGRSSAYWQSLRGFWKDYFQNTGAALKSYSVLREMPQARPGNPRRISVMPAAIHIFVPVRSSITIVSSREPCATYLCPLHSPP